MNKNNGSFCHDQIILRVMNPREQVNSFLNAGSQENEPVFSMKNILSSIVYKKLIRSK